MRVAEDYLIEKDCLSWHGLQSQILPVLCYNPSTKCAKKNANRKADIMRAAGNNARWTTKN